MIAGRTILDAYKWFHDITTQGAWLVDDHIDMAMDLLRDRVGRYPQSFHKPGRIILNTEFFCAVTIEYQSLQLLGNEYVLLAYMLEWVIELSPSVGEKSWKGCTHLYIPVISNQHCIALEIVFTDSMIYVYDPDHSCLTQGQLE
ncbi:uncharacterized protein LOC111379889 [Olea europaea var. sylvestris]|uniref:uncharacterized protein LOC111379889 n=1 Tax=Olea europaea var. sylvestris TaxID=158386 RepID=UPI000C1D7E84|nr:uncharacterized protein LOC111379889 [Olea europaea var. sylvestris]